MINELLKNYQSSSESDNNDKYEDIYAEPVAKE